MLTSLKDVLPENYRNVLNVRLATNEEIDSLRGEVSDENIRDHIVLCSIIKFEFLNDPSRSFYSALGFNDFETWITSGVRVISQELIQTKNSVYSVEMKQAEPPAALLAQVQRAVSVWQI